MSKIRIALIEDHDLTRTALRTALKQYHEVEWVGEASNGREGLQLFQRTQPDVGIVDIGLPDIDGIELTKKLKALEPPIKILILTLHDSEAEVLAAFAAGADSYCMKTISTELLIEALRVTREGNAWIDPAIAKIVLSQAHASQMDLSSITDSFPPPTSPAVTYSLTERELEVLQLIVDGHSNAEISKKLFITIGTVKTHVRNILNKLCADDRTQAAVRALRTGLVS